MIGIFINGLAIVVGTAIGCLFKNHLKEKYIEALWLALGLAAFGVGANTVVSYMSKSNMPLLFIISLTIGALVGKFFEIDQHIEKLIETRFTNSLAKGVATATFLDCIGALSLLGPINAAKTGDLTFLLTNASLTFVCAIIFGASFGWGMLLETPVLLGWFFLIFGLVKLGFASFFTVDLVNELCLVGGFLIIASSLGLLKIKEVKSLDLLPSLLIPILYFLIKSFFHF
ncbi:DUF554 family protein [Lactobacillus psittaci]|uniref:Transport protein n=1 Tax=Lactobacillus psittaci DSM 15354 TaxID=1122152 RepID=A0A0R1S6A7_9LACO|nr:DUF554 family protein [Lactobacillus psittaci]KRL64046.1 transport protein [Lactobacillus psittaci DSM 15354]